MAGAVSGPDTVYKHRATAPKNDVGWRGRVRPRHVQDVALSRGPGLPLRLLDEAPQGRGGAGGARKALLRGAEDECRGTRNRFVTANSLFTPLQPTEVRQVQRRRANPMRMHMVDASPASEE